LDISTTTYSIYLHGILYCNAGH